MNTTNYLSIAHNCECGYNWVGALEPEKCPKCNEWHDPTYPLPAPTSSLRAKFRVGSIHYALGYDNKKAQEIISLWPVCGGSSENNDFFKATPTGKIEMTVDNQAAWGYFKINNEYYVDFTEASVPQRIK